jgi:multiple sugar transport system permease protein
MINIQKWRANPMAVVSRVLLYAIVGIGAVIFSVPFLWMVRTSIMPTYQVYIFPPEWMPDRIAWEHWLRPFEVVDFARAFRNNATITAFHMVGTLLSCSVVAFGFARLRFVGRNVWFFVLLSTMMLPGQVTLIPTYVLFSKFGWINTFKPLIVPSFFGSAFFIFLLRQYYMTIPLELDDAAKIDGCNTFGIFWRIIVPLSVPALAMVAIMDFSHTWDWFMSPLIYLWDYDKFNIPLSLLVFFKGSRGEGRVELEPLMAASIMAILPTIIVFFVAQKRFIQGIVITGIKG